jgi:hypothetical protein
MQKFYPDVFYGNHDENSWNKSDFVWSSMPFAVFTQTMAGTVPLIMWTEEPVLRALAF